MDEPKILTPLQRDVLVAFFEGYPESQAFFLTGGSALAEFYLRHRYSDDLDIFTMIPETFRQVDPIVRDIATRLSLRVRESRRFADFAQYFLEGDAYPGSVLKVDWVRDVNVQFGEKVKHGSVIVDSLVDITTNKICAILGRTEIKDFVDLYILLKEGDFAFDDVFTMAKEKDLGLTEFYFAGMLREVEKVKMLPRMVRPVTLQEVQDFFLELSDTILDRLNPLTHGENDFVT
jgi:hypothetical protein